MLNVQFISDDPQEKDFSKAVRQRVKEYFKQNNLSDKANAHMVWKTVILLSVYIVPFLVLLFADVSLLVAILLTVLIGIGIAGVGMSVMHDSCHGAYSKKPWVNDLLSGSIYLLGSNVINWKTQHNVLHHSYTNISGMDEDIDEKGIIRLSENTPLKKYHKFQHFYAIFFYGLMTLNMLVKDFAKLIEYKSMGLINRDAADIKKEFIKMAFRKFIYLFIVIGLPIILTDYSVLQILAGFFIAHWVASIILSFVFQLAHVVEGPEQSEYNPVIHSDRLVHQMKTTANFSRKSKLIGWYVGGLNFQVEHHLFPSICHVHYPELSKIVEETAKEFGVPYHNKQTFMDAFISHLKLLKELGSHEKLSYKPA